MVVAMAISGGGVGRDRDRRPRQHRRLAVAGVDKYGTSPPETDADLLVLANVLNLLIGFMLGVLIEINRRDRRVRRLLVRAADPLDAAGQLPGMVEDLRPSAGPQLGAGRRSTTGGLTPTEWAPTRHLPGPDLAGRAPGRRPGDGGAVGGEVAPSRPPGPHDEDPGGRGWGALRGEREGWVASGPPPTVVGRGGQGALASVEVWPLRRLRPARVAGPPASVSHARTRLRGREQVERRPRTSSCSTTARSTRSATTCWSARAPCCGSWRSRSPSPRDTCRRGTVFDSATNPTTSSTSR